MVKNYKSDDVLDESTTPVELDEELMEQFSRALEIAINRICEDNQGKDPRIELLVTLGLLASQVAYETGFSKEEFISLMEDVHDDLSSSVTQTNKHQIN